MNELLLFTKHADLIPASHIDHILMIASDSTARATSLCRHFPLEKVAKQIHSGFDKPCRHWEPMFRAVVQRSCHPKCNAGLNHPLKLIHFPTMDCREGMIRLFGI